MPSLRLHRYWARRVGIEDEVSEKVDGIIDFKRKLNDYKITHDWIRINVGSFVMGVRKFYQIFGVAGVKAMILHGALDYIYELQKMGFMGEEILWGVLIWIKFMGGKNVIRFIRRVAKGRELEEAIKYDLSYYDKYLRLEKDLGGKEIEDIKKTAEEVVEFLIENFNEILDSFRRE